MIKQEKLTKIEAVIREKKPSIRGIKADHSRTTHGMSKSYLYRRWHDMRCRCDRESHISYDRYGGKGIGYDPRWSLFEEFKKDMGDTFSDGMSLDRVDINKMYCKENCRWVTKEQQQKNKSTVRLFEYNGKEMTIPEIAKEVGMNRWTLFSRIKFQKMTLEQALLKPVEKRICKI